MFARSARRPVAAFVAVLFAGSVATSARAADVAEARITGLVVDQANGLPLPSASVTLFSSAAAVGSPTSTDKNGGFTFAHVAPGVYTVLVMESGYETSRSADLVATPGTAVSVNLVVSQTHGAQASGLRTIATSSARASSALASTTTITRALDPETVQKENGLRLADQLTKLPGINGQGLSSSVGDDTYLNIRGLGASETVALLDGHPLGPQGVYGINGGGIYPNSFNYADTPIFGLNKVLVTFGSGASGLYGVDATGGTVDLETLSPTATRQFNLLQGFGDQGRSQTSASATGQFGKLGYVLAGGVQGTYGLYKPGLQAQTGRPNNNPNLNNNGACTAGNDISACNLALNTYSFSQNTEVKSGIAKLVYALDDSTSLSSTIYASGSQADSTGNGDNDNIPYLTRVAQIQSKAGNCDLPGTAAQSQGGYTVVTDANGTTACDTAQQWAAASSGAFGGGEDRNRGSDTADYHFRLKSVHGKNTFIADGYHNYYKYYKSSERAGGLDATGTAFQGTSFSQYLNTNGYLVSDDITNADTDIGVGFFGDYQLGTRLNHNVTGLGLYSYDNSETTHYASGFARASVRFSNSFSTFANFWVKHSSVDNTTSFDPRVSLVFRPASSDIVRLTYGHSTGDPAAELKATGAPSISGNPSSLNPSCTPYNTIATTGNPNIRAERANDYELGYAHRFNAASSVQANLYYTSVGDQLFSAALPLTTFGPVNIPAGLLAGYAAKIASANCAGVDPANPATVLPFLAVNTTFNATSAVSKGIEFSGHQRLNRQFGLDYAYNLQSVIQNGVADNILQSNPFIVNGGQVQGIPINQGNIGLDYLNGDLEVRTDGYVVGSNNPKSRPGYNTWDGFVSKGLTHGVTLTFGVTNIFDNAVQNYGFFGFQQLIAENHFFNDTNAIQQYVSTGSGEEFGVPERSFSFSAAYHI